MLSYLKKSRWSPYLAGLCISLLSLVSLFVFHKTLGTSTTFVKLAALVWALFDSNHLQESSYYQEYLQNKAWLDWQAMLVLGLFLGAYLSHKLSGSQSTQKLPPLWTKNCGPKPFKRNLAAFIGGIIVMLGARLAGGCTSGHAITGGFQMALSGWIFMITVFALGIPTALFLYPKKEDR